MDPSSAQLVLKMQLEDIDFYLNGLPRVELRDDPQKRNEIAAFRELRGELVARLKEVDGQVAALELLKADYQARLENKRLIGEERQAEADHDLACRLAGARVPPRQALDYHADDRYRLGEVPGSGEDVLDMSVIVGLCGTQMTSPVSGKKRAADDDDYTQTKYLRKGEGEASTFEGKGKGKARIDGHVMCSSCFELHTPYNTLELPCKEPTELTNHAYCRECLTGLFDSSITDPSSFPPRCCAKIIPLFSCLSLLPNALVERFVERRDELDTPNRTYCSNPKCSKWIKPQYITAGVATCPRCSIATCTTCKNKHHQGLCPEDEDVKVLMNFAERKRWKTCPECKNMVELNMGCNHITCRCQHEFCYICTAEWRTCQCPVWDERNIMINAPAQPAAGPPAPAPNLRIRDLHRERPFEEIGHIHNFQRFYRSNGWNTTCDVCHRQDRYINVCEDHGCGLSVCWYCTRYRV